MIFSRVLGLFLCLVNLSMAKKLVEDPVFHPSIQFYGQFESIMFF